MINQNLVTRADAPQVETSDEEPSYIYAWNSKKKIPFNKSELAGCTPRVSKIISAEIVNDSLELKLEVPENHGEKRVHDFKLKGYPMYHQFIQAKCKRRRSELKGNTVVAYLSADKEIYALVT